MDGNLQRKKRVTIKMVAQAAGVSTQTISRVINNRPDVAPETRKRVETIIQRLGYYPSAIARSLIQKRSYTLAVVTAGLNFLGPSQTLNGITQSAEALGYSLLLKELPEWQPENFEAVLQSLLARQVDGIIWAIAEVGCNHQWMQRVFPEFPIPVLCLTMAPQPEIPSISIDNYYGGCLATQHLLDQGYRKIGHIAGPLIWWEAQARKKGWVDTLNQAGISVSAYHWVEGQWTMESGYAVCQSLIDQYPDMEAVFVANDQMALSFLRFAQEQGLAIPRDLAVVGFDGIPETAYFYPPLTTIQQDLIQLGNCAVETLIDVVERKKAGGVSIEPRTTKLQPHIIVRESTLQADGLQAKEN